MMEPSSLGGRCSYKGLCEGEKTKLAPVANILVRICVLEAKKIRRPLQVAVKIVLVYVLKKDGAIPFT